MKPYLRKLATGLVTVGLTSLVFAQAITGSTSSTVPMDGAPKTGLPPTEAGKPVPGTIAKLGWMSGCWETTSEQDKSTLREIWLLPKTGNMLGMGQIERDGKSLGWEAMRLYDEGDTVKAWQRPSARGEFTMAMEKFSEGFVSFALTEGDTTTRVTYQRRDDGTTLAVSFRLIKGENRRGADFAFKRTDCAAWMTTVPPPVEAKASPAAPAKP
ncbi:MAG: DUF6265 family protein [Casimicrobium sp.]